MSAEFYLTSVKKHAKNYIYYVKINPTHMTKLILTVPQPTLMYVQLTTPERLKMLRVSHLN